MSGDGGLAMLMGELLTLRQHKAPVKIIVYRNDALSYQPSRRSLSVYGTRVLGASLHVWLPCALVS
jgi:thiamine pyrophosphate-dependent acetolactate synthase large subunit-like protein